MTPYLSDADVTLYHGDALEVLRELPDASVHCCVTSPPFYGLRDYGTGRWEGGDAECDHAIGTDRQDAGRNSETFNGGHATSTRYADHECPKCGAIRIDQQIGLEETPERWVERLVEVFREVKRLLRPDGTLWLEVGDSYAHSTTVTPPWNNYASGGAPRGHGYVGERKHGCKPKDLIGAPWMLAFALRADGWYLRSDIIWVRPNPMPESVTDRPTKSHSYVFLLTKSPRYFFDQEAVRDSYGDPGREWWKETRTAPGNPGRNDGGGVQSRPARGPDGRRVTTVKGQEGSIQHRNGERWPNSGRNIRSVWEIATQPFPEAHFATFPEKLVERCLKAGTSERGCCPECGAPWMREVGWRPGCECSWLQPPRPGTYLRPVQPCTVLDPFVGAGTVPYVARKLGLRAIGIDLNTDYLEMAARRLQQQSLFAVGANT